MSKKVLISPSILSADQSRLADAIIECKKAGADLIHIDIMDGHFVDNITIGPSVVKDLAKVAADVGIPLDVHLMISDPIKYLDSFIESKPEYLTVHQEATDHLHMALYKIKNAGIKAGVSINPATSLIVLEEIIPMMDLLLIMTVNPGWGGQKYIDLVDDKISMAREFIDAENPDCLLEVDGGVNPENAVKLREMGVDILVAGNSAFHGAGTLAENIAVLRG
ncbi:ribulose-phosphate 3-epimerase [bacterium]|nr:ribulose-phosphate 3-epimerase [bacterium]MBU1024947.1 ribulose-phosphate 3-epimerase [bacterium]